MKTRHGPLVLFLLIASAVAALGQETSTGDPLAISGLSVKTKLPFIANPDRPVFQEIVPCRLLDTRPANMDPEVPQVFTGFRSGETRTLSVYDLPDTNPCALVNRQKIDLDATEFPAGILALALGVREVNQVIANGVIVAGKVEDLPLQGAIAYWFGWPGADIVYGEDGLVKCDGTFPVTLQEGTLGPVSADVIVDVLGYFRADPQAGVGGPAGPPGERGPIGETGPQGPAGPKGDKGATGLQGPKGDTGAQGPGGEAGATGFEGPKGDTGAQGPKGDTGATGPQGPQGAQGAQGPIGLTGPQGPQGLKGDTGAQGSKGDTGATGPQGPQGAQGAQGPIGLTGPQGPQGPKGDKGDQGNPGSVVCPTMNAGSQKFDSCGGAAGITIQSRIWNCEATIEVPGLKKGCQISVFYADGTADAIGVSSVGDGYFVVGGHNGSRFGWVTLCCNN